MAQLSLFLLGSPRLERDGQVIEVDTRKAIALMAYLAVTGQSHSRDALATLLWPDYDQAHARATLRRTLSALNKALAGDWLEIDRETIGLNPDANLWIDVTQFQQRLELCRRHGHPPDEICPDCLPALTEAVNLYRDHFLAGFTLRDSPDFDDWQFFQTEGLRRDLARVLENLMRCHIARPEFDTAINYARRWLALDPLHEQAHRELMRLYAWTGQRGAALRQYRECVRIFDQELGVPPLEETTQLYEAIQENRLPPPPLAQQRPSVGEKGAAPPEKILPTSEHSLSQGLSAGAGLTLVGRSKEWQALLKVYLSSTVDGHLVVLQGEAGIGKTRLAEEFLAYARRQGGTTLAAQCYEGETNLAYGLFIEGVRATLNQSDSSVDWAKRLADLPDHWLAEAARLWPELTSLRPGLPPPPALDSPGAQSRFFEGVSQLLWAVCRGPVPGILLLDDLHWADAASLDLLTYLVRRLRGRSLCLLVTWRSESISATPRLQQLLVEAQRSGAATHLFLSRFNQADVMELVNSTSAGAKLTAQMLPAELGQRLYQESEGLPFFLVEYLAVLAQGELNLSTHWAMPGGVRGLLQSRLAGISETGWQLLTTAAVIGRSFDFDTLRAASGRSDEEMVMALEALIERGVVAEVKNNPSDRGLSYDFSHEKLRALVYDETSLTRRRLLHRRVAEALLTRARGRSDLRGLYPTWPNQGNLGGLAAQIANHYQLAGQDSEAAEYFKLAGEHAAALYANAEALSHYRAALALGHPETAALHQAIGDLHTLLGEYNAALTSYEIAAALSQGPALINVERKLGDVHHRRGEWELAESHFQAALLVLQELGLNQEGARLYGDWSLTAHQSGQPDKALTLAQRARELAETAGDQPALAQVYNLLGILARSQNNLDLACQHLEQSLRLAENLGDHTARIAALNNLALACSNDQQIERAIQLTETALALCAVQGDRHREAALHNNLADLLHAAGQTEAAMTHLKQAVTILAEIGAEAGALQPEIWKLAEW
jgi:predicted ATPase/DNA-binding SARP family transcriptional activator